LKLTAYFLGARQCADEVGATARPEDLATMSVLHRLVLEYLQHITSAVTAGYLQAVNVTVSERHSARQLLLTALREGRADESTAAAGIKLPSAYLVLALALGPHLDERVPDIDTTAVAQRKLRRLRSELDLHSRGTALTSLATNGGLALLPIDTEPGLVTRAHWDSTAQLLVRLERAGQHPPCCSGTGLARRRRPGLPHRL
jgi:hypothetical protein